MKTNLIKTFALSAVLVLSSVVYAQSEKKTSDWAINDTVVVKRSTTHYLTGEEPSTWVYDKKHTIQQIGGKRFPEGILLREIISWVGPNDIEYPDGTAPLKSNVSKGRYAQYTISDWHVGDTIMIKPETKHYLTGEEPSTWVYDKKHTIQQLGSTRFPEGVLVRGIYSWVGPNDIYPAGDNQQAAPETKPQDKPETKPQDKPETKPQNPTKPEDKPEVKPEDKPEDKPQTKTETKKDEPKARDIRMTKHHRFSIGVRGGAASLMQHAEPMNNWKVGFDGILDLQYAYYFGAKEGKKVNHGIITGLSVGYAQSPIRNGIDTTYTVPSNDGNGNVDIQYTITADEVKETDRQIQVEIPLMYSLQTEKGFFLNAGARFMVPVYKFYNQTITNNANTNINAYFDDLGVTVKNEDITGVLGANDYKTKGQWSKGNFVFNVMLTAELGWEWQLKSGNALGLGVYGNFAPYNSFKNETDAKSLIDVTAPNMGTPASVNILSATDTYADKMNYFDGGLKLIYHFQFPVNK